MIASSAKSSSTLSILPLFQISSNQRCMRVAASGCSLSSTMAPVADIRTSMYFGGTVTQTYVRDTNRGGWPELAIARAFVASALLVQMDLRFPRIQSLEQIQRQGGGQTDHQVEQQHEPPSLDFLVAGLATGPTQKHHRRQKQVSREKAGHRRREDLFQEQS